MQGIGKRKKAAGSPVIVPLLATPARGEIMDKPTFGFRFQNQHLALAVHKNTTIDQVWLLEYTGWCLSYNMALPVLAGQLSVQPVYCLFFA